VDRLEGLLNDLKPPPKWRHSALAPVLGVDNEIMFAGKQTNTKKIKKTFPFLIFNTHEVLKAEEP